ncbi:MAG: acetyl-CoA carboxylase carboxyltransferase subunit alpha [Candidatus Omnitrophica bacterium]|jgi:acetyl-CoA carboxylase carboxyl transferase subunit alpha|nr:acetyl-CoA carboxylase carboxyltransferase subunit alpha [Candidatus Omnitrophota bacterium]
MNGTGLDFEKPILELERKVEELKKFTSSENIDLSSEIKKLEDKLDKVKREVFESLSPWQRVQIARHPKRPYTLDYIGLMMTDFVEVHGDRVFGDDKALICGFAKIDGQNVVVMGHQKGRDTKENLMRNFGSAHPEGYRKAMRVMHMGEKFKLPIIVFIDTPGAYPGIGAEERGQAEAIALNLMEMARLKVPIVCYIIGEGGSGGALGVGIGDRICVLENAYYSVISPEGCAAILWKDRTRAPDAAKALKLTAQDLLDLGLIEEVVPEPLGGAHRDPAKMAATIKDSAKKHLKELLTMSPDDLIEARYDKYRKIGAFSTE